MSYTVSNRLLRGIVKNGYDFDNSPLRVALYENNVTPSASSVFTDFNITYQLGLKGIENGSTTTSANQAKQAYRHVSSINGPNTIYGVVISVSNVLLWAHRFTSPINIADGDMANIEVDFERIFRQV